MSGRQHLCRLRQAAPAILPSLLMCDFGNLEREIRRLEDAGVPALHLDVMDGHFVPNLTYGMPIVNAIRRLSDLPLDVHLMIAAPDQFVEPFRDAGADILTFHVEAVAEPSRLLGRIRDLGLGAGVALNPDTPLTSLNDCWPAVDLVLIMSVPAGYGGQSFNPVALEKLRRVRELAPPDTLLEVDGGVNASTIQSCAAAGAELFVVGSAIFGDGDYQRVVSQLAALAQVT